MRTTSLLPIDELNNLNTYLDVNIGVGYKDEEEIFDEIEDLLIMAYIGGTQSANADLSIDIMADITQLEESINKPIAGKTWKQRVRDYLDTDDVESIKRVIDTETHRIYNEGQYNTAKQSGLEVTKTWVTMLDERVRDTHSFLEGVTVGLDEAFTTIDGDSALAPGGFESAENNINCRCELRLSKGEQ